MTTDAIEPDFEPPREALRTFDAHAAAGGHAHDAGATGAVTDTAFEGAESFAEALYRVLGHAESAGARSLCWCDADFGAWPLGESAWLEILTRWARGGAGRELVMVAASYAVIERDHPRFVEWRRDWSHVMRCLEPEESHTLELPSLWVDTADQAVRVFDRERWLGRAGFDRADRQQAREEFDAIAQRGAAAFATVTLGL
jgi:hypothetical protein